MTNQLNNYVTVKQFAYDNVISVQAVYQAVKRKTLLHKKIGSIILIKKDQ